MTLRNRNATSSPALTYPAGIALGAVLTHLASEFFGMGADADAGIFLSPRHAYLGLIALACIAVLVHDVSKLLRSASGPRDLRRLIANRIAALPLGGGWRFYLLTAVLQFSAGVGSAIGEGCFFCGHDVAAGIAGALATTLLLILAGRIVAARLPKLAAGLEAMLLPAASTPACARRELLAFASSPRPIFWSPQLANRPPPLLS